MSNAFPERHELPVLKLADGTPVKLGKPSKMKKSRRGQRFNGKHND